jgi:hypothetical protein
MDVGTPVTFMGRPLKVYDRSGGVVPGGFESLRAIDSATAESLSLVEEIFNKTNFMNRQITFPGGKTILGSEVFDHIGAYHYFTDPSTLGLAAAAYAPQDVALTLMGSSIDIDAKSVMLARSVGTPTPVQTKAQLTIHEIIHAAAHRSGAMPNDFTDQIEALQTGRGTVTQATLVGANEAFAESLSHQLVAEAGITDNLVASGYDTMREIIHLNQNTPFRQDIELATAAGLQKAHKAAGQFITRKQAHSYLDLRHGFAQQYLRKQTDTMAAVGKVSKNPMYQAMASGFEAHRGGEFISPLDSTAAQVSHGFKTLAEQAVETGYETLNIGKFVHRVSTSTGGARTSTRIIEGMEQAKRVTGASRNLKVGVGVAIAGAGYMHHRNKNKG